MRSLRLATALFVVVATVAIGALGVEAWRRVQDSDLEPTGDPNRIYSASPRLMTGAPMTSAELASLLDALDERDFDAADDRVTARLRAGGGLEVRLADGVIRAMSVDGQKRDTVELPPVLLATWLGPAMVEHRRVALADVPPSVVHAVLAAEDAGFFAHPGVSPRSIARAAWANLRAGHVRQGGSTITQQLVKNVYLDPRRTMGRKLREAALAVALEVKDDKKRILEAYLNEIYFGHDGPVQMVGLGAAARGWFDKAPARLSLSEAALLAGMIHCPGAYDPRTNPGPARARRDRVLARMVALGWATPDDAAAAAAEPIVVTAGDPLKIDAPWFAQAVAVEAASRYGVDVLRESGLTVHSKLDWLAQRRAEQALAHGLDRLDDSIERGASTRAHPLEGALVSLDAADGAILSYVGGRDRARSTFDRARQARRMLGSAFKPVVYAAALEAGYVEPYTLLGDTAWSLDMGDRTWTPHNYDRTYHGLVPAQLALAQSLNVPAAQLAMDTGLDYVSGTARRMGIVSPIDVEPAIALGAVSAAPLEVAAVFGTLAGGGVAHAPHGIVRVLDREGNEVAERFTPGDAVVLSPETAYEMTSMLRGVVDYGTGASARAYGVTGEVAGKTGTSDDRRDVWFAGYSSDRVTVVWVGYDDNRPTRLSGATGALPTWAAFMRSVRPPGGFAAFTRPSSMVTVTVDPATGLLAGPDCPMRVTVDLPDYRVPFWTCEHLPVVEEDPYGDDAFADTSTIFAATRLEAR